MLWIIHEPCGLLPYAGAAWWHLQPRVAPSWYIRQGQTSKKKVSTIAISPVINNLHASFTLSLFFLSPSIVADFGAGAKNSSMSADGRVLLRVTGVPSSSEFSMFWTCTSVCIPFRSISLSRYPSNS